MIGSPTAGHGSEWRIDRGSRRCRDVEWKPAAKKREESASRDTRYNRIVCNGTVDVHHGGIVNARAGLAVAQRVRNNVFIIRPCTFSGRATVVLSSVI